MTREGSGVTEAVLLVGGLGTRLRPLTLSTPKPLLPTAGVPFLVHQLARLREAGLRRVVLATSYHGEIFQELFAGGSAYGLELECVTEEEPLGTGGGIRNAAERLTGGPDDPVLVLNGDVLSGHDIAAQVALHQETRAAATLHLTEVADARSYGCVPTDADGRVIAFLEKSSEAVTPWINAGCYVFARETIARIPAGEVVSVEKDTFPALLRDGALVMAYPECAYWLDVGTPAAYVQGSCDLVLGRLRSAAVSGGGASAHVASGANVAPDAVLEGGTAVGAGSLVGPGAEIDGSVLFDGVTVGEGAVVRDSALARDVTVGAGTVLEGAVVGARAAVGPRNELRTGVRLWPGIELPAGAIRFSSDV